MDTHPSGTPHHHLPLWTHIPRVPLTTTSPYGHTSLRYPSPPPPPMDTHPSGTPHHHCPPMDTHPSGTPHHHLPLWTHIPRVPLTTTSPYGHTSLRYPSPPLSPYGHTSLGYSSPPPPPMDTHPSGTTHHHCPPMDTHPSGTPHHHLPPWTHIPRVPLTLSLVLALSVFSSSFSCRACLISMTPVSLMKNGRLKGGFSIPLFPWRYLRLKHQWRGTGTVFRVDCTAQKRGGSKGWGKDGR